jgi:hypothetical protein
MVSAALMQKRLENMDLGLHRLVRFVRLASFLVLLSFLFEHFSASAQVSFSPATNFIAGGSHNGIAAADIDGDGKLDLIIADLIGSNPLTILTNAGNGIFKMDPVPLPAGPGSWFVVPTSTATGDWI